jgi:peroxiredoxin
VFGIARKRQEVAPPSDALALEEIVVRDPESRDVRLGDVWAERPATLVFLRHYGCTFCRDHAVRLNEDRQTFEAAGAPLTVIGQGTPANAAWFRDEFDLELDLLVDTDRLAYRAAGTKVATFSELLGPGQIVRGLARARGSGVRQGKTVGHPAQLGGLMLVMPGGDVPWTHLSDDAGDYPPNTEVVDAVRGALAG